MEQQDMISHHNKSGPKNSLEEKKQFLRSNKQKENKTGTHVNDDGTRTPASQPVRSFSGSWWVIEILSSIVSLAAIGSLIGVLRHFDGHALQTWPYKITLNSVVAALSTVARTALMIPVGQAVSQGAWNWFSATRQKKKCESRLEDLEIFDGASRGALGSLKLLWRMKGRHIASIGALLTILVLAFDIFTQQVVSIRYQNAAETDTWRYISRPDPSAIYNSCHLQCACTRQNYTISCDNTTSFCNYTLPTGTSAKIQTPAGIGGLVFQVTSSQGHIYNASSTTIPYIANFDIMGAPYLSEQWTNVTAFECALWYCVQAYNITMNNSRQTQSPAKSWSTISPSDDSSDSDNLTFTNIPSDFNIAPDAQFVVGELTVNAVKTALIGYLNGTVYGGTANEESYSSDFMQAIWNSTSHIDTWISNLALSMTNDMLQTEPASSSTLYAGTVYRYTGFIQVRWAWLTFPIVIVLGSVGFLVLSMIQTRRSRVGAWKSSPLVMLLADLDRAIKHKIGGEFNKANELITAVGNEKVVLTREAGELEFVSNVDE
ncbi:Protein of unknown function DUF3176 [Penicillium occitanis (nom. inval.)]|nr:Protein of unknown function DUF3176 [Penicillium occitanis (nom. inval.)]PCH05992.1 hypothetical protein PENOC_026330 [Penicillium occitanis (nom. inval.)]